MDGRELITRYQSGERDFSRIDLSGVDPSAANLSSTNLQGAKYNSWTAWPEGFSPSSIHMHLVE